MAPMHTKIFQLTVKPENVLLKRMDRDAFEAMASEEMARFGQAAGRRRTGTSSSLPRQGTNLSDSREHTSASFSSAGGAAGQGGSMEFDGDTSAQLVAAGEVTGISANDIPVPRSLLQSSSGNQSPAHRSPVAQGGGTTESRGRLTLAQSVIPEDGQCALPPIDASPTVSRGSSALTPVHRRHERSVSGHLSRARTATSNGVGAHGHPVVGARSSSVVSASGTVEMDDSEGMFPRLVPSTPMLGMPPGSVGQRNASEGQFSMSSNATAAAAAASTPKRQNTAGGRLGASSALPPSGFNRQIHAGQAVPITLPAPRSSWAQVDAEMSSAELTYSKRFKGPNSTNPEVSNVGLVPLLTKCAGGDRGSVLALRSLTAKLCDFGCAIHAPAPGQIPVGKSGKGSTSYCAPEVAIVYLQGKSRPIFDKLWPQSEAIFAEMYRGYDSCLADVWSFGVTLFVTGSGRLPFRVASVDSSTFRAFISTTQPHVVGDEITAPYTAGWPSAHLHDSGASWSWPRGFSPALIHLLRGCLAVRPSERFTMEQVKSHPWFGNPMWIPTDSDTQHLNNATSGSVPISNLT